VGDAYHLDCSFCEVQIEISKKAYATRCEDPEAVLESVRAKLAWSKRPRIDVVHMQSPAPAGEETTLMATKSTSTPDALTTAAQAIGSTLGKLAVKTGIAKAPAKKAAKKTAKKAAAKKTAPKAKKAKKAAPRKAAPKPARGR
jgi:ribonuclease E